MKIDEYGEYYPEGVHILCTLYEQTPTEQNWSLKEMYDKVKEIKNGN